MPQKSPTTTSSGEFKKLLLRASGGFIRHSTEMALYTLLFPLEMLASPSRHPKDIHKAADRASWLAYLLLHPEEAPLPDDTQRLADELTRRRFKRRLYYLQRKGLIRTFSDKVNEYRLTQAGKKRLAQIFPSYLTSRPWDGKIYLVTYDIPEERRKHRDLLREYLRRLGCAMLQQSVWVSVYDPRQLLRKWAKDKKIAGSVVVSDVGEDGSIAGKTIPELVQELYDLETVDNQYQTFIHLYQGYSSPIKVNQWMLNQDWCSCVEHDPQLPFELLPRDFSSFKAYKIYQKLAVVNLVEALQSCQIDLWQVNKHKYLRRKNGPKRTDR